MVLVLRPYLLQLFLVVVLKPLHLLVLLIGQCFRLFKLQLKLLDSLCHFIRWWLVGVANNDVARIVSIMAAWRCGTDGRIWVIRWNTSRMVEVLLHLLTWLGRAWLRLLLVELLVLLLLLCFMELVKLSLQPVHLFDLSLDLSFLVCISLLKNSLTLLQISH